MLATDVLLSSLLEYKPLEYKDCINGVCDSEDSVFVVART